MRTIKNKRAAIYARIAPTTAVEPDREAAEYLEEGRQFVLTRGGLPVAEYLDLARGTSSAERPEYDRMLVDAQAGLFEVIVVHSPSRLFRDQMDYIFQSARLRSMGIETVIVHPGEYSKFADDLPR